MPPSEDQVFEVRVFYEEPTYAQARGIPVKEYSGTFYVRALNETVALDQAIDEFTEIAAQSRVGWARQISRCVVRGFDPVEA
jgi:hypothetical protein